ncbi:MAG TPA: hypothetical protein VMA13_07055 [Candidatus Saccharimonadales bacterium]|nr:hypothetical protein [Candidatus Saccharimonadales bacterium]
MKCWAVLTVLLYALALLLLTAPVILIAFGNWGLNNNGNKSLGEVFQIYLSWGYWLWLAIMVAGQALLLLLPINIAERRLPTRRPLKLPVIVSAFFLANLCFAGIFSILCAIFTDQAFNYLDWFSFLNNGPNQNGQTTNNNSGWSTLFTIILIVLVFWLIWSIVFSRFAKTDEPDALLKRITHWLLRGSILELLIAVPSHVIVRRRDDCCAPAGTFWGIATGISVMLLCFGPGVFFLFAEKFNRLKPKLPSTDKFAR